MKATLGIIAIFAIAVALAPTMQMASAVVEQYHNYDVKRLKVKVWYWGTGNIKNVEGWVTFNHQIKKIDFDYSKVKRIEYKKECPCYAHVLQVNYTFPATQTTYNGWGNFFHVCVKNEATTEQTCQLGNWGWSTGYVLRIPNAD